MYLETPRCGSEESLDFGFSSCNPVPEAPPKSGKRNIDPARHLLAAGDHEVIALQIYLHWSMWVNIIKINTIVLHDTDSKPIW